MSYYNDDDGINPFDEMAIDNKEYEERYLKHIARKTQGMNPEAANDLSEKMFSQFNQRHSDRPESDAEINWGRASTQYTAEARQFDKSHMGSFRDHIAKQDGISIDEANQKVRQALSGPTLNYHIANKVTGGE